MKKSSNAIIKYFIVISLFIFCSLSIYLTTLSRGTSIGGWMGDMAKYASIFEDQFYDFRMVNSRDTKAQDKDIILVHIDDRSLAEVGRWPWSRKTWVEVVERLKHFGAKVLAFDVLFSEPEKICSEQSPDELLGKAFADFQSIPGNKIILPYSMAAASDPMMKEIPGELYNFIIDSEVHAASGNNQGDDVVLRNIYESKINSSSFPVAPLLEVEPGLGFFNTSTDSDGVFRHFPIIANMETIYFPSLALITYEAYTGDKSKVIIDEFGNTTFNVKGGKFYLNRSGETKVRFFGDRHQFGEMSILDLLKKPLDDKDTRELINGKIIYIASTALGAQDLRNTPLDSQMPGVYVHMNLTHMLLKGFFYKNLDDSVLISLGWLIFGLIIIILIQRRGHAILDLIVLLVLLAISYIYDTKKLLPQGYEIRLFFCYFGFIGTYSWITFLNFYKATKEKKQIKGAFSQMIAPAIVNQMLEHPEKLTLGGEKKDITCFFSDVRDFTTISEQLTPSQLSYALNKYMTVMTDILFDSLGTLDKYIGDAIVGYWGAPVEDEQHAYHAMKGALRMVEALPAINEQFVKEGLPEFRFGIGMNSGVCSVGNMGSDKIFSYTALGDHMNLGARLEGLCKFYGVQIMISEFTLAKLSEEQQKEFTLRKLDMVRVKGKEKAVTIYEVLHSFHLLAGDQPAQDSFRDAFTLYTKQKFNEAIDMITPYCQKYPNDKSFQRLLDGCKNYLQNPPPADWDGVTTYTTK